MTVVNDLLAGYTQGELDEAFKLVAPEGNWKLPINCKIRCLPEADLRRIAFAIEFFTGSVANITTHRGHHTITAAGYYAAIGA